MKTPWEKLWNKRQIRKFMHAQIQILAKFYSFKCCSATKKTGIFRARLIVFPLVKFEVDKENEKLRVAKEISAFKWSAGQISQIVKIMRAFTEENWRKSKAKPKVITGERLPSWSHSSIKKPFMYFIICFSPALF